MSELGERAVISLAGLPHFLVYLAVSLALLAAFALIYMWVTPHRELTLIRAGNTAASISFGSALLGFAIPLAMSVFQSHDLVDMVAWAVVALIVQIAAFFVCGFLVGHESQRITEGETASATFLAFTSVAAGVITAACMTY